MRKVNFTLTTDSKEIVYLIDADKGLYSIASRDLKDGEVVEERISESGELGNLESRQEIAKRVYYILLTSMKNDRN